MEPETNGAPVIVTAGAYSGFRPPEPVRLPSGDYFLLTRPRLNKMIRRGMVPNPLMEVINQIFEQRDEHDVKQEADLRNADEDDVRDRIELEDEREREEHPPPPRQPDTSPRAAFTMAELTAWSCIVEPEVEMEPMVGNTPLTANGKLSWDAIDEADIMFIIRWANEGIAGLDQFRTDSASPETAGDRSEVRDDAEPVTATTG